MLGASDSQEFSWWLSFFQGVVVSVGLDLVGS